MTPPRVCLSISVEVLVFCVQRSVCLRFICFLKFKARIQRERNVSLDGVNTNRVSLYAVWIGLCINKWRISVVDRMSSPTTVTEQDSVILLTPHTLATTGTQTQKSPKKDN